MSIKPCTFEQDLLFSIHKIASPLARLRTWLHCLACEDCRRRRDELLATTRMLRTLAPQAADRAMPLRSVRKARFALCLAALALIAAAYSIYSTARPGWFSASEPGIEEGCAPASAAPSKKSEGKTKLPHGVAIKKKAA